MFSSRLPLGHWHAALRRGPPAPSPTPRPAQSLVDAGAAPPVAGGPQGERTSQQGIKVNSVTALRELHARAHFVASPATATDRQAPTTPGARAAGSSTALPVDTDGGIAATGGLSPTRVLDNRRGTSSNRLRKSCRATKRRQDLPGKPSAGQTRDPNAPELDLVALENLTRGIYTHTSKRAHEARVAWWVTRANVRQVPPFPLTPEKLQLAGALLKQGKYRSAAQYLYSLKKADAAQGGCWSTLLAITFRDVKRSCERGLGASRQADALPLGELSRVGAYGGCRLVHATESLLIGVWWMLREIELANLAAEDITITAGRGCGVAAVRVSASKTDWRAKGLTRRHGCACPSPLCPVRAAKVLLAAAMGLEGNHTPLVRGLDGRGASKKHVEREIKAFARHLGATAGQFTGHSLRVTGAQRLAMAGVSEDKIRVFGRWAGQIMLHYVRDSLLTYSGLEMARQVVAVDSLSAGSISFPRVPAEADATAPAGGDESGPSTAPAPVVAPPPQPTVTIVVSTEGVAHRWATDLHTVCGWAWFVANATKTEGVPTCRRCLGTSVRWACRR